MWCKYVSQFGLSSTQRFFCGGLPIVPRKSRYSTVYCGGPHECERPLRAVVLRIEGTERSILQLVRLKQASHRGSSDYSGCSDLKTRDTGAGAMPGCLSTIAHALARTARLPRPPCAQQDLSHLALSFPPHSVCIRSPSIMCPSISTAAHAQNPAVFFKCNNRPLRWFNRSSSKQT